MSRSNEDNGTRPHYSQQVDPKYKEYRTASKRLKRVAPEKRVVKRR